jgi:flagellar protein FlaJ
MAEKKPEIKKLVAEEAERAKEEEEQKKKLRRETAAAPERGYETEAVESIVTRLRRQYEERGITAEEKGKAAELKELVTGRRALMLDQRVPADLVSEKKPFLRFVGRLFKTLKPLNKLVDRIGTYAVVRNLPNDLDRASMNFSARQYIGVAVVASLAAALFFGLLSLALIATAFGPAISEFVTRLVTAEGPVGGLPVVQGLDLTPYAPFLTLLADVVVVGIVTAFLWVLALLFALKWPGNVGTQRAKAIDKDLPFALRHMATEIKAGIGIHKTMKSLVDAKYGVLSEEFERTLHDIEKGVATEDALVQMAERTPSENLSRAMLHVVRALKTGGNLSDIIGTIADDVAFELRMKMRDFVERLNLVGLFYMMVGIVFPVFVAVLAGIFNAIPTIGLAGVLGASTLFLIYFLLIPMALGLILYIIKVMQPL